MQRFGSKAALLAAVADDGTRHAADAFDAARDRTDSPLDAIVEAMAAFAGDIHDWIRRQVAAVIAPHRTVADG